MAIDISDRQVKDLRCQECGRSYHRVVIFARRDESAYSLISAVCHGHPEDEVWLDATFGSWEELSQTMSRFRAVSEAKARQSLTRWSRARATEYYGKRLTREDALLHPVLPRLWELVDEAVTTVPQLREVLS